MLHRIIRSLYTGHWRVGCYIRYSEEGPGRAVAPPSPLLVVPNVTTHPSTASVPITVMLHDGRLHCGFNLAIKALKDWYILTIQPRSCSSFSCWVFFLQSLRRHRREWCGRQRQYQRHVESPWTPSPCTCSLQSNTTTWFYEYSELDK